ncbi:hypothetical protein [Delftia acidovorans]
MVQQLGQFGIDAGFGRLNGQVEAAHPLACSMGGLEHFGVAAGECRCGMARHAQGLAGAGQLQLGLAVQQDHGGEAPRMLGRGFIAMVDADVGADQLQARGSWCSCTWPSKMQSFSETVERKRTLKPWRWRMASSCAVV